MLFSFFIYNVFRVAYRPDGLGVKFMLITVDNPFEIFLRKITSTASIDILS